MCARRVDRVIMNGGKAMYLVEALTPYFASARSLSVYATRMVGRTVEPYRAGIADATDPAGGSCIVEDIQLEFDRLVVSCHAKPSGSDAGLSQGFYCSKLLSFFPP